MPDYHTLCPYCDRPVIVSIQDWWELRIMDVVCPSCRREFMFNRDDYRKAPGNKKVERGVDFGFGGI